jgi:hypothetical protein
VLYSFTGGNDGAFPVVLNTFKGTSSSGAHPYSGLIADEQGAL